MGDRSSDRTFHGTVSGHGLTCISFTTDDGHHYALTGDAIPARVRKIAHSGFRAGSGAPQQATLTVVGHVDTQAMSSCAGYTVLVAGKVTVESVGQASVPGT